MMPELESDLIDNMSDAEVLRYIARQLQRLEPLMYLMENPPPALAGLVGSLPNGDADAMPSIPSEPLRRR